MGDGASILMASRRLSVRLVALPSLILSVQADDRFFWNKFLQSRLIDATLSNGGQDVSIFIYFSPLWTLTRRFSLTDSFYQ